MKVAFATDDGKHVNTHFGFCDSFEIYSITDESYEKVKTSIVVSGEDQSENGRIENRLEAVIDCTLLFITQIGPAAAARVTRNKIMPIKVEDNSPIEVHLERLLTMLQSKPPMWLKKVLNESKKE